MSCFKSNLCVALTATLLVSSCGQSGWDADQANALPSVGIDRPTKVEKAYGKPIKASASGKQVGSSVAMATGLAGGFIGGAAGALIVEGVAAANQAKFERDHAGPIASIERNLNHSFEDDYKRQLEAELKRRPFFSKRLKGQSPYRIQTQIQSYRLTRSNNSSPMEFSAVVSMMVSLEGHEEAELMESVAIAGASSESATIENLASDKAKLDRMFKQAARSAAINLGSKLDELTSEVTHL